MGPEKSGSSFHKDPNSTSAWNAVIRGSKKWILYPPSIIPPGVHQSPDQSEVATPVSLVEWFLNFYEETKTQVSLLTQSVVDSWLGEANGVRCACRRGAIYSTGLVAFGNELGRNNRHHTKLCQPCHTSTCFKVSPDEERRPGLWNSAWTKVWDLSNVPCLECFAEADCMMTSSRH